MSEGHSAFKNNEKQNWFKKYLTPHKKSMHTHITNGFTSQESLSAFQRNCKTTKEHKAMENWSSTFKTMQEMKSNRTLG